MGSLPLLKRLTASNESLDAAALETETEKQQCEKINCVQRGRRTEVYGRVTAVRYRPTEHVPVLEAELFDGSGTLALVWLGRRRIAGIEPGRKLIARGRVGLHGDDLAMFNPWYELR